MSEIKATQLENEMTKYWVREMPTTYVIEYLDMHGRETFVLLSDDATVMKFSTRDEAKNEVDRLNNEPVLNTSGLRVGWNPRKL